MQELIILAGPNGAGKTSFANEFLPANREGLAFVNADEIARTLAAEGLEATTVEIRAARIMLSQIDELTVVDRNS